LLRRQRTVSTAEEAAERITASVAATPWII
jgi:hypothetical protein